MHPYDPRRNAKVVQGAKATQARLKSAQDAARKERTALQIEVPKMLLTIVSS